MDNKEVRPFNEFSDELIRDFILIREYQNNINKYDLEKISIWANDRFEDWMSKFCSDLHFRINSLKIKDQKEKVLYELKATKDYIETFARMYGYNLERLCEDILPDKEMLSCCLLKK